MPFGGRNIVAFGRAVANGNMEEAIQVVTQHGEKFEELKGHSPLYIACYEGSLGVVEDLVKKGKISNIMEKEKNGVSPIEIAANKKYTKVVEYLQGVLNKNNQKESEHKEIEELKRLLAEKKKGLEELKTERDQKSLEYLIKVNKDRYATAESRINRNTDPNKVMEQREFLKDLKQEEAYILDTNSPSPQHAF